MPDLSKPETLGIKSTWQHTSTNLCLCLANRLNCIEKCAFVKTPGLFLTQAWHVCMMKMHKVVICGWKEQYMIAVKKSLMVGSILFDVFIDAFLFSSCWAACWITWPGLGENTSSSAGWTPPFFLHPEHVLVPGVGPNRPLANHRPFLSAAQEFWTCFIL